MNNKKISELKKLLTRLVDSRDGYAEAAEEATQERHKRMFSNLSNTRQQYAQEVQEYLKSQGENVELDGSLLASTHRYFMELKNKLDENDDEELLESIITGESNLCENYQDAIDGSEFDPEFLATLQRQHNEIQSHLNLFIAKEEAA